MGMGQRLALVIGTSAYDDPGLARLVAPQADMDGLAAILRAPEVGGFDGVTTLLDQPAGAVHRAVARLFAGKKRDDLLVLYFSGHGVLDARGHLYLATSDTERPFLSATAVAA